MASKQNIYSPRVRKRKAYTIAFRVFMSYIGLDLKARFFGKAYYERRIKALHLKNAERIKVQIQELQGLFVKIGQLVSNLSNVLPEEFRAPLEELQDKIPARPYTEIEQTIREQLGNSPDEIFDSFNHTPLAAASIGQVHCATLNGEAVVVKIQHHNIDAIAQADLTILKNLVKIHAFFMNMQGLEHTYEQVRLMIEEELNYQREAESMQRVQANLVSVPQLRVRIPKVFEKYSTKKVLVSSYCEGINIGHTSELTALGIDLEDVAKRLIELYCKMLLVDGFYHADPHPGNILIDKTGTLILLDFGAVAELRPIFKKALSELLEALIRNDTEATVVALRKMGFLSSDKESVQFVEKLIGEFKTFLQDEVQLDGLNFQNIKLNSGLGSISTLLKKVSLREVSNKIQIPKEHILLNRTIVLLMGNAFQLAPELDVLGVVRPHLKRHILNEENGITTLIVNTFKNQLSTAIALPNDIARFLKEAKESELEQEIKLVKQGIFKLHRLLQQFMYCFLLIAILYAPSNDLTTSPVWQTILPILLGSLVFLLLHSIWKGSKS